MADRSYGDMSEIAREEREERERRNREQEQQRQSYMNMEKVGELSNSIQASEGSIKNHRGAVGYLKDLKQKGVRAYASSDKWYDRDRHSVDTDIAMYEKWIEERKKSAEEMRKERDSIPITW